MRRPSELKEKVADLVRGAYIAQGLQSMICAGDFITPQGMWKRADVFRWELKVQLFKDGRWYLDEICSWDTLTDCARYGIEIDKRSRGGFSETWEAHAKYPKPATGAKTP